MTTLEWPSVAFILGIVGNAAVVWWRTNDNAKHLEDHDKRLNAGERWQTGADKVLGNHEKRLDNLEESQ